MKNTPIIKFGLLVMMAVFLTACAAEPANDLQSAGYLSAMQAGVASEMSGRVVEINVEEGQQVKAGDPLFSVDSEFLIAQRDQASAAVKQTEAAFEAAEKQAVSARAQYELALQAARANDIQARTSAWTEEMEEDYRPAWYFQKAELINAAQAQAQTTEKAWQEAQAALERELESASVDEFIAAEESLAQAQLALSGAQDVLDQAKITLFGMSSNGEPANGNEDDLSDSEKALLDAAEDNLASAESEFEAALLEYDRMLTSSAAEDVIQARARVAVARSDYDSAQDALMMLQTGEDSLQVTAAKAGLQAAESLVLQAQAGMEQAQQALKLAELQLERAVTLAPMDGVVMSRNLEVGELAAAGGIVMEIARLEKLELIVYLSEDLYGRVGLGDSVVLTVDSYPGQKFVGQIIQIADEAEFTPRNVQTEAGRKSTVYAVRILVENPDLLLKPGMPADAQFTMR